REFAWYDDDGGVARIDAQEALQRLESLARTAASGLEDQYRQVQQLVSFVDVPWRLVPLASVAAQHGITLPPAPETPDFAARFEGARDQSARDGVVLDLLACNDPLADVAIERVVSDRRARRRLAVGFLLQGNYSGSTPRAVVDARLRQGAQRQSQLTHWGRRLVEDHPLGVLRAYLDLCPDAGQKDRDKIRALCTAESLPLLEPKERKRERDVEKRERKREPERQQQPTPLAPTKSPTPTHVGKPPRHPPPKPTAPAPPPKPSIWREHLRPFLLENWYVATGALMVVVGASLLAYFTWDRHWLVRYTVLPVLLGGFTATLAWLGGWLERRDPTLTGTGAVLRGAAIALLPINFMTVALLAGDPQIASPQVVVPIVAALYLGLFGWGLRAWCAGVHPPLKTLLGGTLTALCALVLLRPLAQTLAVSGTTLRTVLGVGFYAGFLGLAVAVLRFTSRVLDEAVARESRVPWFFGGALVLTFLQVFAWVHASIGHLPRVYTYAPMLVLAGGLVLHVERRVLALSGRDERMGAESFLGYAMILLGVLMAQPSPWVRVIAFTLAGLVWIRQSTPPRDRLHAWIGLTLIALGGASLSLVPGYPGEWRPWFGIGMSLAMGAVAPLFRRRGHDALAEAARQLEVALAVVSVVVAMLTQWHFDSAPLMTAALLIVAAALILLRGHRERSERWVLTGAVVLAAALPYLGCVDLQGRTLHGNTMVFGLGALSLLWIALDFIRPTVLTRRTRSAVLWFYGALAVAGMVLRVVIERGTPGDLDWPRAVMDHAGPVLVALALGFATFWSRSLVPAAMAATILVILFPELRSHYHDAFQTLGWGTGLGSAVAAAALVAVCFWLRRLPALQSLGRGDRFLGRGPFPFRRHDWTLFTLPLVGSIVFLLGKAATVVLIANLDKGMTVRAASAQLVCGAAWIALGAYGVRYPAAKVAVRVGFIQCFVAFLVWPAGSGTTIARALVLQGVALQALAIGARRWGGADLKSLLVAPAETVLHRGALILSPWFAWLLVMSTMVDVADWTVWAHALAAFLAIELTWHGVASRRQVFGAMLFPLLLGEATVAVRNFDPVGWTVPWNLFTTAAGVALVVGIIEYELEWASRLRKLLRPVMRPLQSWSAVAALGAAGYAVAAVVWQAPFDAAGLWCIAFAAFGVARSQRSGIPFVAGAFVCYLLSCTPLL
ncbi:MAG: hypothetical protein OER88_06825, partial [Planctomycetota bacterium]|nr:hypothetical protein [Planctomycetota bacterium]